jgi:TolA-binding protein
LFQKGFAFGLVNRPEKKVSTLNQLLKDYPKSAFDDDALYELGRAYVVLSSNSQAITSYTKLIKEYPTSSYVPKAWLNLGLIYFNTNKNQDAIGCYQKVVDQFPGTPDSRNALNGLKTVYMDMNNVDAYFSYLESKGEKDNVRISEQDSLVYTEAENKYMSGDCDNSSQQFTKYIDRFTNGSFLVNANFYLADCELKNNKKDEALKGFEYVIAKPRNMFTEQALVNAANILYNNKNYGNALVDYKQLETEAEVKTNVLEAKIGEMRCNYKLNDFPSAVSSAKALLSAEKLPDEMIREARFILAKSYLEIQDIPAATEELKFVSKDLKSAEGAECKYRLSKLYYDEDKKELAEKEIFDFIKKNTDYQYWLGKSFLLLSDIYVDKKDEFQATQTLQSLLDYYEIPDDGIKTEAKEKKDKLTNENTEKQVKQNPQDLELNMDNKKVQ